MIKNYLQLLRGHGVLLGLGFAAVFWGNFGQSFFIGAYGESIQQGLGLNAHQYGNLYSLATVASALAVTWLGGLIDRVPLKFYSLAVSVGLFLAMLLLSQVTHVALLALAFFMLRLFGQALLPHTGITTMARSFQARRGTAISIAGSGFPVGEIVLPKLAALLIAWLGWQQSFLVFALTVPLILIPLSQWCLSRANLSHPPVRERRAGGGGRKRLLQDYRFWLLLPGYMAAPFMVTGIFVHQNFVIASKGWTLAGFATAFVVYGSVHWLSSLVAGALVDRFRAVRLLPFYIVPLAGGLLLLGFAPGDWVAPAVMALLALTVGSSPPIANSLWPEIYGSDQLGAIRSLTVAIMVLATSASPSLFGYLIDAGWSLRELMAACVTAVVAAVLLVSCSYPLNPRRRTARAEPE